jgi:hypothetical protein
VSKDSVLTLLEDVIPKLKNASMSGVVDKVLFDLNLNPIID